MTRTKEGSALLAIVRGDALTEPSIDWDRVEALAWIHGVMPLLTRATRWIPDSHKERFRDAAEQIAIRNLAALQQLLLTAELLRAEGIRPVATKGPALALRAYGDVSRRSFSDLDILVTREDAKGAIRVLGERGYEPEIALADDYLDRVIHVRHEVMFAPVQGLPVEIHWAIAPRHSAIGVPTDDMVGRAVTMRHGAHELQMLMREDEIIYLATHASKHHWERLAWVVDLDMAVRSSDGLDWGFVAFTARQARAMRALRVGCYLSWTLLHSEWVPRALAAIGADRGAWRVAAQLADKLFEPGEDAEHAPEFSVVREDFLLRDGVSDRARLVWRTLTTPTERELATSKGSFGATVARTRWVVRRGGTLIARQVNWTNRGS